MVFGILWSYLIQVYSHYHEIGGGRSFDFLNTFGGGGGGQFEEKPQNFMPHEDKAVHSVFFVMSIKNGSKIFLTEHNGSNSLTKKHLLWYWPLDVYERNIIKGISGEEEVEG